MSRARAAARKPVKAPGRRTAPTVRGAATVQPLHVAVIGCGSIGRRHLRNLRRLGCARLSASDPSGDSRRATELECGVAAVADARHVLESRPHAALICAPTADHAALAGAALAAGCHVFIEKPLAAAAGEASELQRLAASSGRITMVGCNMRFHPGPAAALRWLREGAIGRVQAARWHCGSWLPSWRPQSDYRVSYSADPVSGGAILDCIHELDLALWMLGPARLLSAVALPATALELETDGLAELWLRHECGALSSLHLNFVQRDYRRGLQLIGELGTIDWDWQAGETTHYDASGAVTQRAGLPRSWTPNQMYVDELAHFLAAIRSEQPAWNCIAEARVTLNHALAAREIGKRAWSA